MNKLVFPIFLALIVATSIMVMPILLIQASTIQNGVETAAPVAADEKAQGSSSFATIQTVTRTGGQTELSTPSNMSNVLYMLATGVLVASAATFIVVKTRRAIF
jgi:hypothetical protein